MKKLIAKIKDGLAEKKVKADCAKGKHRWAEAYSKSASGEKSSFRFCQTCGEIDK